MARSPSEIPLVEAPTGIDTDLYRPSLSSFGSAWSRIRVASRALRHLFSCLSRSDTFIELEYKQIHDDDDDNFFREFLLIGVVGGNPFTASASKAARSKGLIIISSLRLASNLDRKYFDDKKIGKADMIRNKIMTQELVDVLFFDGRVTLCVSRSNNNKMRR